MMNFDEFKNYIAENIKTYLPNTYETAKVELTQITKNNDQIMDAVLIRQDDVNISPTIYLNDYFKEYENGREMRDILHDISSVQQRYALDSDIDISRLTDFDLTKDKIVPRLVNAEKNSQLLSERPHTMMADLAITYHIEFGEAENGKMTVPINNGMLEKYGISVEELHEIAMKNVNDVVRPAFMSMREMLSGMLPDGMGDEMLPPDDGGMMHILTSHDRTHGAAAILSPETMEMIQEKMGDFFILPSSIHEVIILKDDGQATISDLENLVQEVNQTQVAEQELLSDHVYKYDSNEKEIFRADKEAEHLAKVAEKHQEKEAGKAKEASKSEKKPSLKAALSDKKQAVEAKKLTQPVRNPKARAAATI